MKRKGQLLSLDFLLSIVLVVIALGLSMQYFELNSYEMKDKYLRKELETIGENASNLLVSSPNIVCDLIDERYSSPNERIIGTLNNCITLCDDSGGTGCKEILKNSLGIIGNFDCNIEVQNLPANTVVLTDCTGDYSDAENVYSVKRRIVFSEDINKSFVSKKELNSCILKGEGDTDCGLSEGTIILRVWKA